MKTFLILLAISFAAAETVIGLKADNFDSFIKENDYTLVKFFTTWCGHCKKLAPIFSDAAKELSGKAKLAEVDCDQEKELCQRFEVKGYPTLKVFNGDEVTAYSGGRGNVAEITKSMEKIMKPLLTEIFSVASFDEIQDDLFVFGFFRSKEDKEFKVFENAAKKLKEKYSFYFTLYDVLADSQNAKMPTVRVVNQEDEKNSDMTEKFDLPTLEKFIVTNSGLLIKELSAETYQELAAQNKPMAYFFYETDAQKAFGKAPMKDLALKYGEKMVFLFASSEKFGFHADALSASTQRPTFVIHEISTDQKFPLEESLESETSLKTLSKFTEEYFSGSLVPKMKTEPVPETNDEPVKVVVGSMFESIVLDLEKDVMIEVYAPWCGHCKNLAPIYDELAADMKNYGNVVIAKMDGTKNDVPAKANFKVKGFPTLKFFKSGTNEMLDYNGARTLEAMKKFILENSGTPLEVEEKEDEHEDL